MNENDIRRAIEITESLRKVTREMTEERSALIHDGIKDLSLAGELFRAMCGVTGYRRAQEPGRRKLFVFIAIYVFNPMFILERRKRRGLCAALAALFHVHRSVIIEEEKQAVFLYLHYRDFRDGVHSLFTDIIQKVSENNLILFGKLQKLL